MVAVQLPFKVPLPELPQAAKEAAVAKATKPNPTINGARVFIPLFECAGRAKSMFEFGVLTSVGDQPKRSQLSVTFRKSASGKVRTCTGR